MLKPEQIDKLIQNYGNMKSMPQIMIAPYFLAQGYKQETYNSILNPPEMNDKWLLNDIEKAIHIINKSRKIAVIADYDMDGVGAATIAVKTLRRIGKDVVYYVPNRFKDGYGLNINLVQKAFESNADTILTVDNGIAAHDAIDYAVGLGLTVIVTDHHKIQKLPNAHAIIHPALGNYPFPSISGCQVSYKLAQAIFEDHNIIDSELEDYFLQLSTLTIVSDVMPVASENMEVNENRKWLIQGLESINKKPCMQIKALMKRFDFLKADESTLGFYIVPCINAIGRLNDATFAVEYFLSGHKVQVEKMADKIVVCNEKRKEMVEVQMKKYKPVFSSQKKAVFVIGDKIHEGIAGLIAGRYSSGQGTVSFCFTKCEKMDGTVFYKGSGRNDTDISLIEMLNTLPKDIMIGYGGHKDACGLSVYEDKIDEFVKYVSNYADTYAHPNKQFVFEIRPDQINQVISFVKKFKPFGNGMSAPIIKVKLNSKYFMTTKSGNMKIATVVDFQEDTLDLWLKTVKPEFYDFLETIKNTREHASGAISYYVNTPVEITTEINYLYSKNEEKPNASYNAIECKLSM